MTGVAPEEFRRVMGLFATGVTVVTTRRDGGYHGMTANAFASLSLSPPLVLVCIDKGARTHGYLQAGGSFAVNVLAREQEGLSRHFAHSWPEDVDVFYGISHRLGSNGCPLLEGCLAYLECRVAALHAGGDHTIFVGQVETAQAREGTPLLFYRGGYHSLPPSG